jgi:REP element-mobilizing transposase RayT
MVPGARIATHAAMGRPPRIPNYPYFGVQRYFITCCARDRVEHFRDPAGVTIVIEAFIETAREYAMTVVVHCVMPDHMHLLLDGDHDGSDLKAFMKLAKQRAGFRFKQRYHRHLWQEGYYEHILRDEEKTEEVVFYIIANPLRKHLVENVLDYPHWGSMRWSREELLRTIGLRRT